MIIETQQTPDPEVMNFFPPHPLIKAGMAEFADAKSLRKSPLAEKLFDLGGIKSLFITADLLSVTKESDSRWEDLKPQILAELMDHLSTGAETMVEDGSGGNSEDSDVIRRIKGLIDARIRPAVKQDGGDIIFKDFREGVVYVEMQGNCAGCPYALITLKEGVEKILKTYIPEVRAVKNFSESREE